MTAPDANSERQQAEHAAAAVMLPATAGEAPLALVVEFYPHAEPASVADVLMALAGHGCVRCMGIAPITTAGADVDSRLN